MKFIELTEANNNEKPILINIAHITVIHKGLSGQDTHVRMSGNGVMKNGVLRNEYYFVKESVNEIKEMLKL